MHKLILTFLITLFSALQVTGQTIVPRGQFLKDSVQIGEPVIFALSIKYPKSLELVFPDSTFDFSPFEIIHKKYFPTKSDSIFSYDTTLYSLTTFEIDTVQYLQLPIFVINEFDSTILYTSKDSIILKQVVSQLPDSVAMVTNTTYVEVPMAFNYPYATIGLLTVLIVILILWVLFGKKVRSKIKIYRLNKQHQKFMLDFENLVQIDKLNAEAILTLWKKYLEKLLGKPFTKLTTKEISKLIDRTDLEGALIAIDRNIYGPKDASLLTDAYVSIKELAIEKYEEKVTQTTHG